MDSPIFRVDGIAFGWEDLALVNAEAWSTLEREAREGLACVTHLARAGLPVPRAALDDAAASFRYARNLVSADDADAWLSARDLTVEQWMDHLLRGVLRAEWHDRMEALLATYPGEAGAITETLRVDAIATGVAQRLAREVAGRAGVAASVGQSLGFESAALRRESIERGLQRFALERNTEEAIAREVRNHRAEWIRCVCETLEFADAGQAREAALCIREDGVTLAALSDSALGPIRTTTFFLEEIDEVERSRFLAAVPGDLIGPLPTQGRHLLHRLQDKRLPTTDDPTIRDRATARLLARAAAAEVHHRVTWEVRW